jgi:hypothetical protein
MIKKQFIEVCLVIDGTPKYNVSINCIDGMHELEVHCVLEKMFPRYVSVEITEEVQSGYKFNYMNGCSAVAIFRSEIWEE